MRISVDVFRLISAAIVDILRPEFFPSSFLEICVSPRKWLL